jgi:hypothetical protein
MAFEIVLLIFASLVAVGAVFAFYAFKINREEYAKTGKHPKGHYMGIGIAIGVALGIPIGLAMDMISIGPAIGVALGVGIGSAMEKKHAGELRPLTKRELEMKKKLILFLLFSSLLGLAAFIAMEFLA